jgi:uncharacterized protein (DUF2147 family)
MIRMFSWIFAAVTIPLAALPEPAIAHDPAGIWLTKDGAAKVRLFNCGEALCGSIMWLAQSVDAETGKPQADKLNADPQLRSRPVVGIKVVLDMQRMTEDNIFLGRVYNPEDGNTYNGSVELLDPARLKVTGCVAIHCQSEIWTRSY